MNKPPIIGCEMIIRDVVDSTNNYTNGILRQSVMHEGSMIIAKSQQSGKGQTGNTWEAEPDLNVTFSFVIYPGFIAIDKQFLISKFVSIAIVNYLKTIISDKEISIKWPNDILIENRKIAGILIENSIQGNNLINSIVGIGLNVNQEVFTIFSRKATSIKNETGLNHDVMRTINELAAKLTEVYSWLCADLNSLDKLYLDRFYLHQKFAKYLYDGKKRSLKIIDIRENGHLVLEDHNGSEITCSLKEIEFLE